MIISRKHTAFCLPCFFPTLLGIYHHPLFIYGMHCTVSFINTSYACTYMYVLPVSITIFHAHNYVSAYFETMTQFGFSIFITELID